MRLTDPREKGQAADAAFVTKGRNFVHRTTSCAPPCLLPSLFLINEVRSLLVFELNNETYAHIPLIAVISLYRMYTRRDAIFVRTSFIWKKGCAPMVPGIAW